jgi:hypothetical protein
MQDKKRKADTTTDDAQYVTNKTKRDQIKQDFYMFQKKLAMKSSLDELRAGFEKDKKRLEKAMRKETKKLKQ